MWYYPYLITDISLGTVPVRLQSIDKVVDSMKSHFRFLVGFEHRSQKTLLGRLRPDRGNMIKEYFLNYEAMNNDFTICLGQESKIQYNGRGLLDR